eukprot:scaffold2905_cov35-Tisochrysis_lutea.AAC.3
MRQERGQRQARRGRRLRRVACLHIRCHATGYLRCARGNSRRVKGIAIAGDGDYSLFTRKEKVNGEVEPNVDKPAAPNVY